MTNILVEIYRKHLPEFNEDWYHDYDSNEQRDSDTALYNGEIAAVEVISDEKDPEDEWNHRLIFKYEDKCYACPYREGSHGSGICFYIWDIKEVFPKTKEVIYYE